MERRLTCAIVTCCVALLSPHRLLVAAQPTSPWPRHVIDRSSRGADGVRLADVNGDGRLDLATGWEEGGKVRVYLHPGPSTVRQTWPSVTVGQVGSPEDALLVDLDQNGRLDVLSCCEGSTRAIFVHWSPERIEDLLHPERWNTQRLPNLPSSQMWMYACALPIQNPPGVDLVVGSKGDEAGIWRLKPGSPARQLDQWTSQLLRPAGWTMSLITADLDQDQDLDLLLSDRKGPRRGVFWLENPGLAEHDQSESWQEHLIGAADHEVMFLTLGDFDADHRQDIVVMTLEGQAICFRRSESDEPSWQSETIALPLGHRRGKGVAIGDVDRDGHTDLVITTEDGCVAWRRSDPLPTSPAAEWFDIGGSVGYKFDRVELLDLDEDGDLDVLTCEERDNLGVVWYENR